MAQKQVLTLEQAVRKRAFHFLSPEVAACAAMTIEELQRFLSGGYVASQTQLETLARRMGIKEEA